MTNQKREQATELQPSAEGSQVPRKAGSGGTENSADVCRALFLVRLVPIL
jgi:hypothetical protein